MINNAYSFIIVPDATSQCKRYRIPKFLLYIVGVTGTILLIVLIVLTHIMFSEYTAIGKKAEQVDTLKKISLNQKNTIDRYEEDIAQLSKNLSHIKQLNSRLMILTGLDPNNGDHNLGLGGSEETDSKQKD
jgi:hypothetical protein